jgi:hypothetical protein
MSGYDEPELERMLRAALDGEARRLEPAGDGLTKIRERVRRRRRWASWLKPTLALAGAAAVAATLVVAPSYLTSGTDRPLLVDQAAPSREVELSPSAPLTAAASTQPSTAATATPSQPPTTTPSGPWGTPIGGDRDLPDRLAIWPYPSRRIGHDRADSDVATGRYPDLSNPGRTAVDFVASYVGSDQQLSATRLGPAGAGVQMVVQRKDVDGHSVPVSNVYLVRVRKADDSPYVVLGASRAGLGDSLAIFPLPRLAGTDPLTVTGNARQPAGGTQPTVQVALREPGSGENLGLGTATLKDGADPVVTWSVELAPFRKLTTTGTVAAWTTDIDGNVQDFVAAPITQ